MDIIEEINRLKKEKNAVILSHYYVDDNVKEIADYTGDSYYLSKVAKETDADIIVLSGVSFMGESAKLLNPEKTVLMPDSHADCPMAHMATVEYIEKVKEIFILPPSRSVVEPDQNKGKCCKHLQAVHQ